MYMHVHTRSWNEENVYMSQSVLCSDMYVPFCPILFRWSESGLGFKMQGCHCFHWKGNFSLPNLVMGSSPILQSPGHRPGLGLENLDYLPSPSQVCCSIDSVWLEWCLIIIKVDGSRLGCAAGATWLAVLLQWDSWIISKVVSTYF